MPYTITAFSGNTTPTGPQLDSNFNAMALQSVTPCTVTGTNALTLTPKSNTYTITAYAQSIQISGVAASSNSAATTARYGALAFLKVYRDSPAGPVQCSGGEIVTGNAFTLQYDADLDSGAGGWHLYSTTAAAGSYLPVTGGTVTGPISLTGSVGTVGFTAVLSSTLVQAASIVGSSIVQGVSVVASSLASVTRLMVGATAATITRILSTQATLTFSVTPANTTQDQIMAVPGAQVGDVVSLGAPATVPTGAGFTGYIPAAGSVAVRLMNSSTVTLATVVQTFRARVEGYS